MFVEIAATPRSVARRKLVHGVGINDVPYKTTHTVGGVVYMCPYYKKWYGMLTRCYSKTFLKKKPTYAGCTVTDSWLSLSNFKKWMETQAWKDKHLDKDLLSYGNKIYGPTTCVFIEPALNNLLTLRKRYRGEYPLGVSSTVINGQKYITASCSFYGKQKKLGYFSTVEEAEDAYKKAKTAYIKELAKKEPNPTIADALLRLV